MKRLSAQRTRSGSVAARALLALMGVGAAQSLFAASQTWKASPTDANWSTATNWVGGAVPGIVYTANTTNTTDIATFNATQVGTVGTSGNPILIETNRMIGGITFDTANASSYFIGAATGSPILTFGNNLTTQMTSTVVNAQTFNAPIALHLPSSTNGGYTVKNDSTTTSATLTLAGGIVNSPNSSRGTAWILSGTNTGENTVSGVINISNTGGISSTVTKTGTGRWVLSNANTISGGVIVSGGTLAASNAGALGAVNPIVNSGGTLEIKNVALSNTSVTLNDGGTVSGNGSAESAKIIAVGAAASSVTLSTVGAGDVFTVGVAANGYTGGQVSTVTHVSGPGTVYLGQSSNYSGGWSIDSGTLRTGNASALGAGGVAFGSGSTGKLQLNGTNLSVSSLSTNATVGTPVIENGAAGTGTLTVNTTGTGTYAGTIQDGAAGVLALTKSGTGTLTLSGANSYSGATTISGGILKANNVSGSATGSGAVTVASGGTLGGSGIISGLVNVNSGGIVAPGNSVGTLTVGSLTAASGSIFNFEFNATPANDQIHVTDSNGLTLNGGGFNLFAEGTTNAWTTTGTYNLLQYAGTIQGTGIGALSVLNPQAGYGYTFGTSGGFVTLDVIVAALISHWNVDSSGSWNTSGNWNNGVPNGAGQGAILDKALSAPSTVTLDGGKTVGGLTIDSANGYTIASGSGGTLTLDSGVSQASVIVNSGTHAISAPVALASNTVASIASGAGLSVSGVISGSGSLTKSGAGSLDLDNANSYSGGTSITNGTVRFVAGGLGSGAVSINGGTLAYKGVNTDDLSAHTVTIGASGATIDIGANNVSYANGIGNGGSGAFTKSGSGTLSIAGNNTYTGATVINQGGLVLSGSNASTGGTTLAGANTSLEINSDAALGAVPGAASTNLIFGAGSGNTSTLKANSAFTINANRTVSLASGTGVIDTNGNNVTLGGVLTGSGNFAKSGAGTLTLGSAASIATGTVTINNGTVAAANPSYLPTGAITLNNDAALNLTANGAYAVSNLTVNGTNALSTSSTTGIFGIGAITGGSGSLTVSSGFVGDFTGSWSGFSGSIALAGAGSYRFNGNTGSSAVSLDLGTRTISVRSTAAGITLGALSGAAGSVLSGSAGGATQAVTYTIGGANSNTSFGGIITNGTAATSFIKVGTGSLTLAGANTYTGDTAINDGSLIVNGSLANTAVTVGATGTLGGFGTVGGATTVNGALRTNTAPADASSRLTFSSTLALGAGSVTTFDINGANFTGVTLTSADSLTFGGDLHINFIAGIASGTYDLFNFTDSNTGSFASVSLTSIGALTSSAGVWSGVYGGNSYVFSELTGDLTVSAVPEPST